MEGNKQKKYRWYAELIMWAITAVIVILVISPIYMNLYTYPFMWQNILFVVLTITFIRWIFLLKFTPYYKTIWFYILFAAFMPLIVFNLINVFMDFRVFIDENGTYGLVKTVSDMETAVSLGKYIKAEMTFFGTSSIISGLALFVRLIIGVWRRKHKN